MKGNPLLGEYKKRKHRDRIVYRGIITLKNPCDLWNYQEIIEAINVHWIIETGTHLGGSALYFADVLKNRDANGKVITIDHQKETSKGISRIGPKVRSHPYITLLLGESSVNSLRVKLVEKILEARGEEEKVFLILDSNHATHHVLSELEAYIPLLKSGDYVVVEDTVVDGPRNAIENYLKKYPQTLIPDPDRNNNFGLTYAPDGYFTVK